MYLITETGHQPYEAGSEASVVKWALDYAREHGNYSGMEEWDEENMGEWIARELADNESQGKSPLLDLYISGPEGRSFVVHAGEGDEES